MVYLRGSLDVHDRVSQRSYLTVGSGTHKRAANRTLPSTAVVELTPAAPALHVREEVLPVPPTALRMHCVPVINLFRLLAQPLTVEPAVAEYRLRPHRLSDGHTEIYSVNEVAQVTEDQAEFPYVPYSHFRQKGGMLKYDDEWPERYYHTRLQRGASGLNDTVLMLGGRTHEQHAGLKMHLNLTCTNGAYPRRALQQAVFDGQMALGNLDLSCTTRTAPGMPH